MADEKDIKKEIEIETPEDEPETPAEETEAEVEEASEETEKADDKPARGTEPDTEDSYCIGLRGSAKTPVAKPAPSSGNAPSEDKKSPATTGSNSTDANAIDSDQSSASSKGANASDDNKRPAFQTTDDLLSAILDAKPNNDKRQTDDHSSDELFSAILDANKNSDKKPIDDKNAQAAADATNDMGCRGVKLCGRFIREETTNTKNIMRGAW